MNLYHALFKRGRVSRVRSHGAPHDIRCHSIATAHSCTAHRPQLAKAPPRPWSLSQLPARQRLGFTAHLNSSPSQELPAQQRLDLRFAPGARRQGVEQHLAQLVLGAPATALFANPRKPRGVDCLFGRVEP